MQSVDGERALIHKKLKLLELARTTLVGSFVLGLILGIAGQLIQGTHRAIAVALMVPFTVCILAAIAAVLYLLTHRCPRCAKPFFWSGGSGNYLSRTCLNCGVRLDGSNV
jgi:uncharacterized membrane protein YwaF